MMGLMRRLLEIVTMPLRALLSAPSRLVSGTRRFRGVSLPAQVAMVVAVFLVICVIVTVVAFVYTQDRSFVKAKLTVPFVTVIAILVLVIPFVLYKALKLWLEGEVSPFPDIDHAWKAGLAALQQHGLDLSQTPLFLILGSASESQEKALFDASRLSLNLREVPQGPAPLHWYANPDGIYLVCSDTCTVSKLSRLAKSVIDEEQARPVPIAGPRPPADPVRGTIVTARGGPAHGSTTASGPVPPAAGGRPDVIRGTMVVGGATAMAGGLEAGEVASLAAKKVIKLPQQEIALQDRRLEYLCHLIRRARQPLCPINGVLTLLPFSLIQRSVPEGIEVQRAVKKDLGTLLRALMVRCAVTALAVGLEEESGFRELVRRVGRERVAGQRFGKGFSVSNRPTAERLEALAAHACGSFEDWAYALFREKGSLSKPGNTKLYGLLCKIRRTVQSRLTNILAPGYGCDPDHDPQADALFFGGCYFAAIGDSEDRQAFVKGVFDKLPEQQEELEWTDAALREDDKYQRFAQLALGLDTLLLLALAGMVVFKWFW
jgi:hypothetical protein